MRRFAKFALDTPIPRMQCAHREKRERRIVCLICFTVTKNTIVKKRQEKKIHVFESIFKGKLYKQVNMHLIEVTDNCVFCNSKAN